MHFNEYITLRFISSCWLRQAVRRSIYLRPHSILLSGEGVCVCVCPYFSLYIFAFAFVLAINIQFEFSIRENGLLHWPSTIKTWSSNRKLITTLKNDVILLNCNLQMERRFMRLAFSLSLFFYLFNSPYLSVSQPFMAMNERNGSKMKMH